MSASVSFDPHFAPVPDGFSPRSAFMMGEWLHSQAVMRTAAASPELRQQIEAIADAMCRTLRNGGKIMFCGNGGSAADAQHIAAEFVSRLNYDREALAGLALTTDTSALTAIGNDYGYDQVFARQVAGLGQSGDLLVAISTSGKSPNVLAACAAAKRKDIKTVAFTGAITKPLSNLLANACDLVLAAPSDRTPMIQQIHITAAHILCGIVELEICPRRAATGIAEPFNYLDMSRLPPSGDERNLYLAKLVNALLPGLSGHHDSYRLDLARQALTGFMHVLVARVGDRGDRRRLLPSSVAISGMGEDSQADSHAELTVSLTCLADWLLQAIPPEHEREAMTQWLYRLAKAIDKTDYTRSTCEWLSGCGVSRVGYEALHAFVAMADDQRRAAFAVMLAGLKPYASVLPFADGTAAISESHTVRRADDETDTFASPLQRHLASPDAGDAAPEAGCADPAAALPGTFGASAEVSQTASLEAAGAPPQLRPLTAYLGRKWKAVAKLFLREAA